MESGDSGTDFFFVASKTGHSIQRERILFVKPFTRFRRWTAEPQGPGCPPHAFLIMLLLMTFAILLAIATPVLADDDDDDDHKKKKRGKPLVTYSLVNEEKTEIDINGENLHINEKTTVILGRNGRKKTPVDLILNVLSIS